MDVEAITGGDLRAGLIALRDELATRLASVQRADAVAPIAKALKETMTLLDSLPSDAGGSVTDDLQDELAKLRAKRPAGKAPAARGKASAGS